MAGSEQAGLRGARADLFVGATWVLTPTAHDHARQRYARVSDVVRDLGATALALSAADHDRLVAMVCHVPHLVAGRDDERGRPPRRDATPPSCGSPPAGSAT